MPAAACLYFLARRNGVTKCYTLCPPLRAIDAKELKEPVEGRGYSIPTRLLCKATGEVEDIHTGIADIVDDAQREKLIQTIKKVDSMTVGELAKAANLARIALTLKEIQGEKLTEQERTVKDIDIATLALFIVNGAGKLREGLIV